MTNDIEIRVKELLSSKAYELSRTIERMEVMLDHIHIFVKQPPTEIQHWIDFTIKVKFKDIKGIRN
ncbi:MAG: transposase [Methanosarcinaceae archaeon]|nr:transposase [Methanosarcinaceae archaeon]